MPYQRPNILSSILFELFEPSIAEAKSVWSVAELVNSRRADLSGHSLSSGLDSRLSIQNLHLGLPSKNQHVFVDDLYNMYMNMNMYIYI